MQTRKRFLQGAAATVAATAFTPRAVASAAPFDPTSWSSVRAQFDLDPHTTNLTTFLLAPHPRPVREAIARHARGLNRDAKCYLDQYEAKTEDRVRSAAAGYLDVDADEIGLTDSTTMGLGLLYGGLRLGEGTEVVTTTHDFYSTHEALRLRALRTGADVRKIRLYADAQHVSVDEVVTAVRRGIGPKTRALAVTWVHSSTGVKLPVPAIADVVRSINRDRSPEERMLLCVDGVHGFGIESTTPRELGCDFLVSGCHKWLFGPRGTGLIWGRPEAWATVTPTIPTFDRRAFGPWLAGETPPASGIPGLPRALAMTPGGFHSFEQRWALAEAFEFRRRIGRARAATRTHDLAHRLKEGLREVKSVRLVTPRDAPLSAGLVCCTVGDRDPDDVVRHLYDRARIVASVTPYSTRYVRFGPTIVNSKADVDRAVRAVHAIAG